MCRWGVGLLPGDHPAYDEPEAGDGRKRMLKLIKRIRVGVLKGLKKLAILGRTLSRKWAASLAYFDTRASNSPVEAINGRLEHLRGIAPGFFGPGPLHPAVTDSLRTAAGPD
jgi:transposase